MVITTMIILNSQQAEKDVQTTQSSKDVGPIVEPIWAYHSQFEEGLKGLLINIQWKYILV